MVMKSLLIIKINSQKGFDCDRTLWKTFKELIVSPIFFAGEVKLVFKIFLIDGIRARIVGAVFIVLCLMPLKINAARNHLIAGLSN